VVLTNFSALMGCNPTYLLCYGLKSMEDLTKFLECKANMYLIVLVNISAFGVWYLLFPINKKMNMVLNMLTN
jgi:hypothetical protein